MSTCGECRWWAKQTGCGRYPRYVGRYIGEASCGEFAAKDDKATTSAPCPFCASRETDVRRTPPHGFAVICDNCGAWGPEASGPEDALVEWNERHA